MKKSVYRPFINLYFVVLLALLLGLLWMISEGGSKSSLQLLGVAILLCAVLTVITIRQRRSAAFRDVFNSRVKFIWRYHSGKLIAGAFFTLAFGFNSLGLFGKFGEAGLSRAKAEYLTAVPDLQTYEKTNKGKTDWDWLREKGDQALKTVGEASAKAQGEMFARLFGMLGTTTSTDYQQAQDTFRKLNKQASEEALKQPSLNLGVPWGYSLGAQPTYPVTSPRLETQEKPKMNLDDPKRNLDDISGSEWGPGLNRPKPKEPSKAQDGKPSSSKSPSADPSMRPPVFRPPIYRPQATPTPSGYGDRGVRRSDNQPPKQPYDGPTLRRP